MLTHSLATHLNDALIAMRHGERMTISPISAPAGAHGHAHEQKQPQRYGADFGGAVTHREVVQSKIRVDPAALAEKMREQAPRPPPRERSGERVDVDA
jgi:hypothetical protein